MVGKDTSHTRNFDDKVYICFNQKHNTLPGGKVAKPV